MLATLLFVALAAQKEGETDVAVYLHAHREADRALTAGKSAEARAGFEKCLELAPKNATVAYGLACACARAGEKDAAVEWLARAVEWGYADAELALWDGDLASLRDSAEFKNAIEVMRKQLKRPTSKGITEISDESADLGPIDVAINDAATRIAVGYSGGQLAMLDARSGKELMHSATLDSDVWDIAMRRDGKLVVALTGDGKLHFWNPDDSSTPSSRDAFTAPIEDESWPSGVMVAFDPTGQRVLVASSKHGARLWSASGANIRTVNQNFGRFGESDFAWNAVGLAWSSDGARIATWQRSKIGFLDGQTGAALETHIDTPSDVYCVAFDPSGKWIASGHEDGRVRLWDAATLKLVRESESVEELGFVVFYVNALRFSPDGGRIALTTGKGVLLVVLDTSTLKILWTSDHLGGRMGEPVEPSWSPDGRRLWAAYASGAMWIEQVDLDDKYRASEIARGRPVEVSASGIAVFLTSSGVTVLDMKTGAVLWTRLNLGSGRDLLQTAGGWFDASVDDVSRLNIRRNSDDENGTPLTSVATTLFDPKRVRAAKAGVALAPVKW